MDAEEVEKSLSLSTMAELLLLLLSSGKKTRRRSIPQLSRLFLAFAEKPIALFLSLNAKLMHES